jgi:hypothetical protein
VCGGLSGRIGRYEGRSRGGYRARACWMGSGRAIGRMGLRSVVAQLA